MPVIYREVKRLTDTLYLVEQEHDHTEGLVDIEDETRQIYRKVPQKS
jgi:hypothetical protein